VQVVALSTHLSDLGVVARQQVHSLSLIVRRGSPIAATLSLSSDFNSQPNEDAYQTIQNSPESPLIDATTSLSETGDTRKYGHAKTHAGFDFEEHAKKRIDYAFLAPRYSTPWDVQGVGILETRFDDGVANSDHRPAVAEVKGMFPSFPLIYSGPVSS
jgi:endonuclease/exonuclease/phosphatase family metal-dependent hydrolase